MFTLVLVHTRNASPSSGYRSSPGTTVRGRQSSRRGSILMRARGHPSATSVIDTLLMQFPSHKGGEGTGGWRWLVVSRGLGPGKKILSGGPLSDTTSQLKIFNRPQIHPPHFPPCPPDFVRGQRLKLLMFNPRDSSKALSPLVSREWAGWSYTSSSGVTRLDRSYRMPPCTTRWPKCGDAPLSELLPCPRH